jgi:hypothetical protein
MPTTAEGPHRNIMNVPWWTDGARVVIELFRWSWSDEPEEDERINEALRGMRKNAKP